MLNVYCKTLKFHSSKYPREMKLACTSNNICIPVSFTIAQNWRKQHYNQQKKGQTYTSIFIQWKMEKNFSHIQYKWMSETQNEKNKPSTKHIYTQIACIWNSNTYLWDKSKNSLWSDLYVKYKKARVIEREIGGCQRFG